MCIVLYYLIKAWQVYVFDLALTKDFFLLLFFFELGGNLMEEMPSFSEIIIQVKLKLRMMNNAKTAAYIP